MSKHPLTEIRQAAVALLQNHFKQVYERGQMPMKPPCVVVYGDSRRSEQVAISPVSFRHTVALVVAVCVQANQDSQAIAETMLGIVEQQFAQTADLGLPELVMSLLPGSLNVEIDDTSEITTVYYQQTYRIIYFEEMGE